MRLFDCLGLLMPAAGAAFWAGAGGLVGEGGELFEAGLADWAQDVLRVGGSRNAEGEGTLMVSMPRFAATASTHWVCQTASNEVRAPEEGNERRGRQKTRAAARPGRDGLLLPESRPDRDNQIRSPMQVFYQ